MYMDICINESCIDVHMHTCILMYTYTYMYTWIIIFIYTHMQILTTYVYIFTCMYTGIIVFPRRSAERAPGPGVPAAGRLVPAKTASFS